MHIVKNRTFTGGADITQHFDTETANNRSQSPLYTNSLPPQTRLFIDVAAFCRGTTFSFFEHTTATEAVSNLRSTRATAMKASAPTELTPIICHFRFSVPYQNRYKYPAWSTTEILSWSGFGGMQRGLSKKGFQNTYHMIRRPSNARAYHRQQMLQKSTPHHLERVYPQGRSQSGEIH